MGYDISWVPPNGLIKRHFGRVTGSEILAAINATEGHENFDALRYVINDFRECESLHTTSSEIEEIAAIDGAAALVNPNILIAVVATRPDVVAAANAYAEDPLTAYTIRIFSSMNDAWSWLELSAASVNKWDLICPTVRRQARRSHL